MKDYMLSELDQFFAQKTIQDVDRATFQVCNLRDKEYKITISLVFLKDWDSLETDSYNSVIIQDKGVVFTLPCYWLSIPKELCIPYFQYIIEDFYTEEVYKWFGDPNADSGSGTTGSGHCPCRVL